MKDERLEKLARVLVDYSLGAKERDQVVLSGGAAAAPLVKEVYARLLRVGAVPIPQIQLPGMPELFFENAHDFHYEETPKITRSTYEQADGFVSIIPRTCKPA
jgi:aminopeptidase